MTAKHRITVNLEEAEYAALQRVAENADRSLAWVGRKAISAFIEEQGRASAPLHDELDSSGVSVRQSPR